MSILVNRKTRVIVQGITGREGLFHTGQMIQYGSQVVAGVTPGKAGASVHGVPVFNKVKDAVLETQADTSVIFVPAPYGADAIYEAASAGIKLIVCITEGIPAQEMLRANFYVKSLGAQLIGPNGPGITTVDECKVGIMPGHIFRKGSVGIVSRSGTLTYEIVFELTRAEIGQTTCVGVGGDTLPGMRFIDILPLFEADPQTEVVVLIGEIGGSDEEEAAEYIKTMKKPVIGFISGKTAPPGKRMGHAGAIISGGGGTAASKVRALESARIRLADTTSQVPQLTQEVLKARAGR